MGFYLPASLPLSGCPGVDAKTRIVKISLNGDSYSVFERYRAIAGEGFARIEITDV